MRDPNRIPEIIEALDRVWRKYPDLRMFQIVGNLHTGDPYHLEDDEFLRRLKNVYPKAFEGEDDEVAG